VQAALGKVAGHHAGHDAPLFGGSLQLDGCIDPFVGPAIG
jgi:hypothetical protein